MNNNVREKVRAFMVYYHGTVKYKLYALVMFALGVFSARVSPEATLLVFIAAFVVPMFFKKSWFF